MAVDDRLEARVAGALHAYLDPAVGPHPRWNDSPAAEIVRTGPPVVRVARRSDRTMLLVAAVLGTLLIVGGLVAGGALLRRPTPTPTPSPSLRAVVPPPTTTPSPNASEPTAAPSSSPKACVTHWSYEGTASPKGLADGVRIDEFSGQGTLFKAFGHPIDTVRRIELAPTEPPFVNSAGKTVTVRGNAFYKLTIQGLHRATQVNDNIGRHTVGPYRDTVASPIAAMRRVRAPRLSSPLDDPGPGSTEIWIIGLERPECLNVTTRGGFGYSGEPGDDAVLVSWDLP